MAAINPVIGGVLATLLAQLLGVDTPWAIARAVVGVAVFALQAVVASRGIAAAVAEYKPKFPSPEATAAAGEPNA